MNIGKYSHFGYSRVKQVIGNYVVGADIAVVFSTWFKAAMLAIPSVIYASLSNCHDVEGVGKASNDFGLDSHLCIQDRFNVKVGTWNLGKLTGRSRGVSIFELKFRWESY